MAYFRASASMGAMLSAEGSEADDESEFHDENTTLLEHDSINNRNEFESLRFMEVAHAVPSLIAKKSVTPKGDMSSIGNIFALFALYSARFIVCPWLLDNNGIFSTFMPILSPVYRQAEHWQGTLEKVSILAHVSFGAIMLVLGTLQFDQSLRHKHKKLHRWCGRAYVISGGISLIALNGLRSSFGAGSAPPGHRSETLTAFVDLACVLWVGVTVLAVRAARRGHYYQHRDWMFFSLTLAATPIAQRIMSWTFMTPNAMMLRSLVCAVRLSTSSTSLTLTGHVINTVLHTRWGEPGSSSSLLLGNCSLSNSIDDHPQESQDSRRQPLVFSLDGYGEGEQASFSLSAWLGLLVMLSANIPRLWRAWLLQRKMEYRSNAVNALTERSSESNKFQKMQVIQDQDGHHLSSLKWASLWRMLIQALGDMVVHKPIALLDSCPDMVRRSFIQGVPLRVLQGTALLGVAVSSLAGAVLTIGVMASLTLILSAVYTIVVGTLFFYLIKIF